jgi:hypothetical protein
VSQVFQVFQGETSETLGTPETSKDMFELEKYHGTKSRHTCPNCGTPKSFVRYLNERSKYLSPEVGRCNRESKCGYHYKPKDFLGIF